MKTPLLSVAVRRVRLLAVLAGLAWLLGLTPAVPVRLLLVAVVGVGLALDAVSEAGNASAPARVTGRGRPGGEGR
ncbi:hypothetical protein ACIQGZ_02630 [Streptomyces sp. NPDC092296]|uniref:hypothetical protein n=1 Tax=Streptomyces sp. NPDC092296 TaxID=3366012 RepID=UPI0037F9AC2A